jgi:hypothetical protein
LYVALRLLLDLQNEVLSFSDEMGAGRPYITVTPAQLYGIETNEYAHELAQMTIQIGYIQWLRDNGYGFPAEPILKQTQNIMKMDAILSRPDRSQRDSEQVSDTHEDLSGLKEPEWTPVDVIIGNPPFLGGKKMRAELGAMNMWIRSLRKLIRWARIPVTKRFGVLLVRESPRDDREGKAKRAGLLQHKAFAAAQIEKFWKESKKQAIFFGHNLTVNGFWMAQLFMFQ